MKIANQRKINERFEVESQIIEKKKVKQAEIWLNPAIYNVGIYLMTPILIGVFVGYSLDRILRTKPIFVIIFIILGAISSFYNFWKIAKK